MYFKKYLIVKKEKIKDNKIETRLYIEKKTSPETKIFFNPKKETAANVGIDKRKDIFPESTLLNSKNLAAVIETPDLLVPGIKDKICIQPMNIADFIEKLDLILFFILNLSLKKSKIPKTIVAQPMISTFLNKPIKFNLTKRNPTNIVGIEDKNILINKSLFLIKLIISFLK